MLHPDVVEAIRAGQFHVYPVTHVDQGLTLLTSVPAGDIHTSDTVHERVDTRLKRLAQVMSDFVSEGGQNGAAPVETSAEES
jgi:predicted ATP-dependent protease